MVAVVMDEKQQNTRWKFRDVELYIENVILPQTKLVKTPSVEDGISEEIEASLRYVGCELIQTAGILLKLPQVAMACAQVLFQRFFYFKSFVYNPMEIVAMACLTLASKIEESVRRNRDIINCFHYLRQKREGKSTPEPLALDANYSYIKAQVIKAERKLLKELGFVVHVKHPHKLITVFLQAIDCQRHTKLIQTAWNYMNDGLRTNIFVRYVPDTIACACIYLAARQHRIVLPSEPPWYEIFGAKECDLKEIALTILRVYTFRQVSIDEMDAVVSSLREKIAEAKAKSKIIHSETNGNFSPNNSKPGTPQKDRETQENRRYKEVHYPFKRKDTKRHKKRNRSYSRSRSRSPRRRRRSSSSISYESESPSPIHRSKRRKHRDRNRHHHSSNRHFSKKSKSSSNHKRHGKRR